MMKRQDALDARLDVVEERQVAFDAERKTISMASRAIWGLIVMGVVAFAGFVVDTVTVHAEVDYLQERQIEDRELARETSRAVRDVEGTMREVKTELENLTKQLQGSP